MNAPTRLNRISNPQHLDLRIGGLTCGHCSPEIEKALAAVSGVSAAHVNPSTKIARLEYDPSKTKFGEILQAVRSGGYTPGTATARIPIEGMHCSSRVIRVERASRVSAGIISRQ